MEPASSSAEPTCSTQTDVFALEHVGWQAVVLRRPLRPRCVAAACASAEPGVEPRAAALPTGPGSAAGTLRLRSPLFLLIIPTPLCRHSASVIESLPYPLSTHDQTLVAAPFCTPPESAPIFWSFHGLKFLPRSDQARVQPRSTGGTFRAEPFCAGRQSIAARCCVQAAPWEKMDRGDHRPAAPPIPANTLQCESHFLPPPV